MSKEISGTGLQGAIWPDASRFPMTCRVVVPDGVNVAYSLVNTLDGRNDADQHWEPDADILPGTSVTATSAFTHPVRGIAVSVERISGGSIYFSVCDSGR